MIDYDTPTAEEKDAAFNPVPLGDAVVEQKGDDPDKTDADRAAEADAMAAVKPEPAPDAPSPYSPQAHVDKLNSEINDPPPAARTLGSGDHVLAAIEHIISGLGHIAAVVPAASGIGPIIAAARMRLDAAKAMLIEAAAGISDLETGDLPGAYRDGAAAVADGKRIYTGDAPQPDHS